MNDLDQITGNDIYNDLKKIKWVKEKYLEEKLFNLKITKVKNGILSI